MSALTATYLLPAVLLNPVLFLHTVNTIISRLPCGIPITVAEGANSPIYGPRGIEPYFDIHANDRLCWSYTALMVGVQLLAFGRVRGIREAGKERRADALRHEEAIRKALQAQLESTTDEEMA